MTKLENYYKKRLNSTLNIDLQPTETEHVVATDDLTFNLLTQEVCINYSTVYTFYFYTNVLYINYIYSITPDADQYQKYEMLTIYPKHKLFIDTTIIDENKVSKIKWSNKLTSIDMLVCDINNILGTDFKRIYNQLKDKKTQFILDAEQMRITIANKQYNFKLDSYYIYIAKAKQLYMRFLVSKNIKAHKLVGSTLVLSAVNIYKRV